MNWKKSLARRFYRLEAALAERRLPEASDPTGLRASLSGQDLRVLWPKRYAYPPAYVWVDQIRAGLEKMIALERVDLEQPAERPEVRFQFIRDGKAHEICLDYVDTNEIDEEFARQFAVYFKMQCKREGYPVEQVVPGGYILRRVSDYLRLDELRSLADRRQYRFDVHGRFGFNPRRANNDLRLRAVRILKDAGYASFSGMLATVGKKEYMEEIAQSRICVDLFGHGYLCSRLVEYMSVGTCIVAPRNPNRLPEPLEDRKHIAFVEPDLSNLIETCEYYLEHEDERLAMVEASREYFDKHLHRDRLVEHYVREIIDRTA